MKEYNLRIMKVSTSVFCARSHDVMWWSGRAACPNYFVYFGMWMCRQFRKDKRFILLFPLQKECLKSVLKLVKMEILSNRVLFVCLLELTYLSFGWKTSTWKKSYLILLTFSLRKNSWFPSHAYWIGSTLLCFSGSLKEITLLFKAQSSC